MPTGKLIIASTAKCPAHPNRKVHARGVCGACYDSQLRAADPGYAERQRANNRKWVKANREKAKANRRQWRAKQDPLYARRRTLRGYGLTLADYDSMLARQGVACAICRKPAAAGKPLNVDHCHATGRVRGLLCFRCNFGLSFFAECPDTLGRAAAHVRPVEGGAA